MELELALLIGIGLLAGWGASMVMDDDGSLLFNLVLGIAGSLVGRNLFSMLGISVIGGLGETLIEAFFGAIVLIFFLRGVKGLIS
jgi:uncharacterized membrane protein YeaQ/YmgE (transglycosylase-associated protein family)